MLKAFPMVKGWLPLVALYKIIKLGGFEILQAWSRNTEKWGYEYHLHPSEKYRDGFSLTKTIQISFKYI